MFEYMVVVLMSLSVVKSLYFREVKRLQGCSRSLLSDI